jgi:hypothetical protein
MVRAGNTNQQMIPECRVIAKDKICWTCRVEGLVPIRKAISDKGDQTKSCKFINRFVPQQTSHVCECSQITNQKGILLLFVVIDNYITVIKKQSSDD